jgi:hypothetical protein
MYANPAGATGELCPVKMLKLLIEKTDPLATKLFNQYEYTAVTMPKSTQYWFVNKPLSKRTFSTFLPDICQHAKTRGKYTAHCLRATAITKLDEGGYSSRNVMFYSGHRCESSIKSYSRVSTTQKQSMSNTLSALSVGQIGNSSTTSNQLMHRGQAAAGAPVSVSQSVMGAPRPRLPYSATPSSTVSNITATHTNTPGFLSHGVFKDCTFNFTN